MNRDITQKMLAKNDTIATSIITSDFVKWTWWIFILTSLFAFGLIIVPIWAVIFFAVSLIVILIFFKLNIAILTSIFLFFLFFRIELIFPSQTKIYAEYIYGGSSVVILIPYILWLFRRAAGLDSRSSKNYLNKVTVVFILWGALSLIWTEDIIHGINLCFSMLINLMIIQILTVYIQSKKDINALFTFLLVAGCILGTITLFSKWYIYLYSIDLKVHDISFIASFGGDNLGPNPDIIRAAGFAPANHAAFGLNIFVFITLSFIFQTEGIRKKIKYILVFFLLIICLVLTGSKAGLLSMIIGLYFTLLINPFGKMKRIRWYFFMTFLLILSLLLMFLLGEGRIVESARGGESSELAYRSLSSRLEIWKRGFEDFDNILYLIFGYGLGSSAARAEILPHMHSFYFSALLDLGIVGLVLYISIILKVIIELYKNISLVESIHFKNLLICLLGALITCTIQGTVYAEFNFPFFWILLGLITSITSKLMYFEAEVK